MNDRVFPDTNILIYSFSEDKGERILKLIETIPYLQISTQVLNEFINASLRKNILTLTEVAEHFKSYINSYNIALVYSSTINSAIDIKRKYDYSYYDSLIIATAIESNSSVLYSEDMQHDQIIEETLTIINPFV